MTPRLATLEDAPAITRLIAISARGLCPAAYTPAQIEAALGGVFGCDSELIRDGTYFVIDDENGLIACGGWGKRQTRFGGDAHVDRRSELLDPAKDAARIRAFFVHPDHAGKGFASALLDLCELEALNAGFQSVELTATLTGVPFYRKRGYIEGEPFDYPVSGGQVIGFLPMRRYLGLAITQLEGVVEKRAM